jgi:hypothetical protein
LGKSLAQRDADVFNGVMRVYLEVAFSVYLYINQTVAGDLVEHVVEEGQAGFALKLTGAIEVNLNADLRLIGIALDLRAARGYFAHADPSLVLLSHPT